MTDVPGNANGDSSWKSFARHNEKEVFGFFGEYRFLSNFWPVTVKVDGVAYPTVENAYQASKFKHAFRGGFVTVSPYEAKKCGKSEDNRLRNETTWNVSKLAVMEGLLYQKFLNPELGSLLKATKSRNLVEANNWGDTFWGVCETSPSVWVGENMLGKILMHVRRSYG